MRECGAAIVRTKRHEDAHGFPLNSWHVDFQSARDDGSFDKTKFTAMADAPLSDDTTLKIQFGQRFLQEMSLCETCFSHKNCNCASSSTSGRAKDRDRARFSFFSRMAKRPRE